VGNLDASGLGLEHLSGKNGEPFAGARDILRGEKQASVLFVDVVAQVEVDGFFFSGELGGEGEAFAGGVDGEAGHFSEVFEFVVEIGADEKAGERTLHEGGWEIEEEGAASPGRWGMRWNLAGS